MTTPGEHKTVQALILAYAQEIGWPFVPQEKAEPGTGFDPTSYPENRAGTRIQSRYHEVKRWHLHLQDLFRTRVHELDVTV
jgi:hypothetical protein